MKHIEEGLKILGLNTKEIKVFLSLLTLGTSTPTNLSATAKIPRTTINAILPHLEKRGFIERVKVKGHWDWKVVELDHLRKVILRAAQIFEQKLKR